MSARSVRRVAWLLAALLLQGCAVLPPLPERAPSWALADVVQTPLARWAERPPGVPEALDSGVRALPEPLAAFAARVVLARAAQRSLDVQYYIWRDDTTGHLLLEELWDAAERGVRVRLLLDDNGIDRLDDALAALDQHPNAEVRLFNPFPRGWLGKRWAFLGDFERLNRRMHNKSFTADVSATIVGGRNIGDEYFGTGEARLFADLDVIAHGRAARDVSAAFDLYWNSAVAYPVAAVVGAAGPQAMVAMKARFAAARESEAARRYVEAIRTRIEATSIASIEPLEWAPTTLVHDDPVKASGDARRSELLLPRLIEADGAGRRQSLDLVSPYFVPGQAGTASLGELARGGIAVRVVTNSLASSDGVAVHAGYARYRAELLRAGVRLYELAPDTRPVVAGDGPRSGTFATSGGGATLHAKTFVADRERLFVGSFNLDPRSLLLNTEMGLVIRSPRLARELSEALDRGLPRRAFEVRLTGEGDALQWTQQTAEGEVRHLREPEAGLLRRLGAGVLSVLPIEWLL